MHKKTTTRRILSLLLAFFLTLCFASLSLVLVTNVGFVGKRNFKESLVKSGYIQNTETKVTEEIKKLLEQKKIDTSIADKVISYDTIYMDISNYIDAVYSGKDGTVDMTTFEKGLKDAINEYFNEHQAIVSDQVNAATDELVKNASNMYRNYVTTSFSATINDFSNDLQSTLKIIGIVSGILAVVIMVILFLLYHYKHHAVDYIIYSVIATTLLNAIAVFTLGNSNFIKSLNIGPDYYLDFLNQMISNCVKVGYQVTAMYAVFAVALFFVNRYIRKITQ
ncbi:MAG: hypothetical protein Q4G58_17305 [bacterium]|nr:hypothetical protein [bacterium]